MEKSTPILARRGQPTHRHAQPVASAVQARLSCGLVYWGTTSRRAPGRACRTPGLRRGSGLYDQVPSKRTSPLPCEAAQGASYPHCSAEVARVLAYQKFPARERPATRTAAPLRADPALARERVCSSHPTHQPPVLPPRLPNLPPMPRSDAPDRSMEGGVQGIRRNHSCMHE